MIPMRLLPCPLPVFTCSSIVMLLPAEAQPRQRTHATQNMLPFMLPIMLTIQKTHILP